MALYIALGVIALLVLIGIGAAVNLVQQGFNGVVTRFGRYHREVGSGICFIWPFFDRIVRVDMRETPRTGDRQDVITRDNVAGRRTTHPLFPGNAGQSPLVNSTTL